MSMTPDVHPSTPSDVPPGPAGLDVQLCFSLYAASIAMGRLYKPLLDELGLTYPQYLVLHVLWEQDGRTVGGVAERLGLESSTVTPLVKRLEAAGFVERRRSRDDERKTHVRLTDAGRETQARTVCLAEAVTARTGFGLADLKALAKQVHALRSALLPPSETTPS